ncbi:RND efflux system, inner membrane transporter [Azospirillum argentinense]|uniref:biotin/lipoyl-binding protein n=1 Tax=Azospirillum argentinense TaxID=2970906 RepID=UPI0032DF2572
MPRSLLPHTPAREALLVLRAVLLPLSATAAEPGSLTVQPRPVEDLKAVFATVESVRETLARTRIGGTVADLTVTEGDKVPLGQVIATVRDPKLPLQLAALDARIQEPRRWRAVLFGPFRSTLLTVLVIPAIYIVLRGDAADRRDRSNLQG